MDSSNDVYIRLQPDHSPQVGWSSPPTREPGSLAFVDIDAPRGVDAEQVVAAFQRLPHRLAGTEVLLLRWPLLAQPALEEQQETPEDWLDLLTDLPNALPLPVHGSLGIVQFGVGDRPRCTWRGEAPPTGEERLLARARAVELRGLLERGNGIWKPESYHYRLPSGVHDEMFVRVGDAIRTPRDAEALATWLSGRLVDDQGLLVDSRTLTPLVLALQRFAERDGMQPGPVVSLDDYPRTRLEVGRAARVAASQGNRILGLLSVSSSGRVAELLLDAMADTAADSEWSLDVLVDKQGATDDDIGHDLTGAGPAGVSTWLGFGGSGASSVPREACDLCRRQEKARVIQIDPRNFAEMALSEPELLVPTPVDATDNHAWWSLTDRLGAIAVEVPPSPSAEQSRPAHDVLAIRVLLDRVFGAEDTVEVVAERLDSLQRSEKDQHARPRRNLERMHSASLALVTAADGDTPGFRALVRQVQDGLGMPQDDPLVFDPKAPEESRERLLEVMREQDGPFRAVAILGGTVTGWTLRQFKEALGGISALELHGLVIHARPMLRREWRGMRNAFNENLVALWLTYVPWRSPLRDESARIEEFLAADAEQLAHVPVDLRRAVEAFLAERRAFTEPPDDLVVWADREAAAENASQPPEEASWLALGEGDPINDPVPGLPGVLWGQPPRGDGRLTVRGESLYGSELHPLALYAAVGAAMQHARTTSVVRAAPQWQMFDLELIARSYYDGPLVATILRWVEPQEAWWGGSPQAASRAIAALVERFREHPDDLKVLIPELLLAACEGKLPEGCFDDLDAIASRHAGSWPANDRVPVEAGRALLAWARRRTL